VLYIFVYQSIFCLYVDEGVDGTKVLDSVFPDVIEIRKLQCILEIVRNIRILLIGVNVM